MTTRDWIDDYLRRQRDLLAAVDVAAVAELVDLLRDAIRHDRQVFVFGNGANAANASHFACDLGKGASDAVGRRRFRILSLNDNAAWVTAIGNDYAYEDVFVRQLQNYARPGDVVLTASVSGSSPNCVKAVAWARDHGLATAAIVGRRRGRLAELADRLVVVDDDHYGRVEDVQMTIYHILCFAFIELDRLRAEAAESTPS